jgi:type VI secretion system secreted protein VgrG
MQRDIKKLQDDGWAIEYGPAGAGSHADRTSVPPKIVIDGNYRNNPNGATQTLAHEVGHATYNYTPDYSSKAAFVNGTLADEGAATMNNIAVQREIKAAGGPDIGIAGNPANQAAYNTAYDQFKTDGDAAKARDSIGAIFGNGEKTSTTNQSYSDYYGGWYDTNYPPP